MKQHQKERRNRSCQKDEMMKMNSDDVWQGISAIVERNVCLELTFQLRIDFFQLALILDLDCVVCCGQRVRHMIFSNKREN